MRTVPQYMDAVRQNKAIIFNGLTFNPLRVKHYALYRNAKPAMELMQSTLPPMLARKSWCACLDAMDRQTIQETGKNPGMLTSVLLFLNTALDLRAEIDESRLRLARDKSGDLKAIVIRTQFDELTALDMPAMGKVREILAAQNCFEIPDERHNPDLVRAEQYLQSQRQSELVFDVEDLVYSVAVNTGHRAEEIWEWPIREFEKTQAAIDRKLYFKILLGAEMSGRVKFKTGNPCPSWRYDKKTELPGGFIKISDLDAGAKGLLKGPETN